MKKKVYFTCDNRSTPYCIIIVNSKVWVYNMERELIFCANPISIFIGKSRNCEISEACGPKFDGNSILIEIKPLKYIFIGDSIKQFTTKEPVIQFVSDIGNNLVPYPYARTKNYIYLILEHKIIPISKIININEPYRFYYSFKFNSPFKNFRLKTLIKRNISSNFPMYYYMTNPKLISKDMILEKETYEYFKKRH